MSDLKPCPICGSEPEFQHFNITPNVRGRIICSCGMEIVQGANETEDDLRIIWNTRAGEGTRWHELFGTPEKATKTMVTKDFACGVWGDCLRCPFGRSVCPENLPLSEDAEQKMLEWLRGDA